MSSVLVAIDGDNIERTLAGELGSQLNYKSMLDIIRARLCVDEMQVFGCFTVPQGDAAMLAKERWFDTLTEIGVQIKRWRRGVDPRTKRTTGYPDKFVMLEVLKRIESFDTLVLLTADRDYARFTEELQGKGIRIIVVVPQPVRWFHSVELLEIENLDSESPGLLVPA